MRVKSGEPDCRDHFGRHASVRRRVPSEITSLCFVKAEALGNDFVIFDNRDGHIAHGWRGFFRWVCDRHYGVGADGVILVERSECAHLRYVHFNPDGSEAGMCGNGSRCVLLFAHRELKLPKELNFEIGGRVYSGQVLGPEEVKVVMPGVPEPLSPPEVGEAQGIHPLAFVDVGVPHFVVLTDDIRTVDVSELGRRYRSHPAFRHGANVDFIQVSGPHSLAVRTYERGVEAETLACGTGAVASVAATAWAGLVEPPVEVAFPGGTAEVALGAERIELSGPAHLVFRGELELRRHPSQYGE